MSAGATIQGEDGIIKVGGVSEIPMLTDWEFTATASLNTLQTRVMKSNNDGGSGAAGGFDKVSSGNKGATFSATSQWQENDAAGCAAELRTTDVGKLVTFELYPNNTGSGKRKLAGNARIASVGIASNVDGVITQTTQFSVDGEWTDLPIA